MLYLILYRSYMLVPNFLSCLSADDFTLERIIELGLDQFAEQIGDVSGAASKELSIEQVGRLGFEFLRTWDKHLF